MFQSYEERVEDSRRERECLAEQTREWVAHLRGLTESKLKEYLSGHVPLFEEGQLDEFERITGRRNDGP